MSGCHTMACSCLFGDDRRWSYFQRVDDSIEILCLDHASSDLQELKRQLRGHGRKWQTQYQLVDDARKEEAELEVFILRLGKEAAAVEGMKLRTSLRPYTEDQTREIQE